MKSEEFDSRLKRGLVFEEKAGRFLTSLGFPIRINLSQERQWEFGESAAHCEIKNDTKFSETGNLFIETRERRYANGNSQWRPAGIYDQSDPWFLLIGSELKLWLLPVSWLRKMHKKGNHREVKGETSEGFLVPVDLAEKIAINFWKDWHDLRQ